MKNTFLFIITFLMLLSINESMGQCGTTSCSGTSNPGLYSSALGDQSSSIGEGSFASGYKCISEGKYSHALGKESKALGEGSFAIGAYSQAKGPASISIGFMNMNFPSAIYSTTIGNHLKATVSHAMVIGDGEAEGFELINSNPYSLMIGYNSDLPTLFVNSSDGSGKTGRIGIGNVTSPQAKLHLRSDDGEAATVFIEPNNWAAGEKAMLALGGLNYGISSDLTSGFAFKSSANYRFINGKVGIGAFNFIPPEAKLHIKCIQGEDADIFLEPYTDEILGERGSWQANLYLGTREHGIGAQSNLGLVFNSSEDFLFNGGTVKMSGLQLNTGITTQAGNVLVCMGPDGDAVWQDPSTMMPPQLWTENGDDIYRMSKVGIGTENPRSTLELSKNLENGGTVGLGITNQIEGTWFIGIHKDFCNGTDLVLGDYQNMISNDPSLVLKKNGSVGIGTLETLGYKLAVNGEIIATEVMIKLYDEWPWPDYVFDESYELMSLGQLNEFIKENKHLPGVPTQAEVKNEGVAVGKMEGILLEKIEELTLYIIAQQEQLETLTSEVERLKQQ